MMHHVRWFYWFIILFSWLLYSFEKSRNQEHWFKTGNGCIFARKNLGNQRSHANMWISKSGFILLVDWAVHIISYRIISYHNFNPKKCWSSIWTNHSHYNIIQYHIISSFCLLHGYDWRYTPLPPYFWDG